MILYLNCLVVYPSDKKVHLFADQHGEQLIIFQYNIFIYITYIRVVQMDIIREAALHVMRRSRTSEKAKRARALRSGISQERGARGRAIYISSVNNAAYPLATRSRDGPTGVHASIYVYKICCARRWRWRRTCRRPWAARRPIKTRRAGRAPRKSGAAVTTIKWPRATIDIGIFAVRPPPPYIGTASRPPAASPRDRFRPAVDPPARDTS